MAKWFLEPGHTAAEFCARHMMVTHVRGSFKNVRGKVDFDEKEPSKGSVEVTIDANQLYSGEPQRDAHLKSADFLDVENHPRIEFRGRVSRLRTATEFDVAGDLTIRGVMRPVTMAVRYLGSWTTSWWEDGVDKGPKLRAGFLGTLTIDRRDFGVNWNATLDRGGIVVSNDVEITIDAEAVREES